MSEGTIITFYSYKGGVGRTFALANIGALLSGWGYKTLCIDWDLEAPGLHLYFKPWMSKKNHQGITELIQAHMDGKQPYWKNYVTEVRFPNSREPVFLMSAGFQDKSYIERVQTLDWAKLYENHNLGNFLEELREDWKKSFDFVLIDSRTGISDIGGICTVQLPEILVLMLTANDQSLNGSLNILKSVEQAHISLPLDRAKLLIMPVISRFEGRVEYKLAQEWLATFAEDLAPICMEWAHKDVAISDLLNFIRIPYVPYWSFGEKLPVIEMGTEDPEDIGFPLETLAALIAQKLSDSDLLIKNRDSFVIKAKSKIVSTQVEERGEHSTTESLEAVNNLNNLALLHGSQGRYEEAEALYKEALALSEKTLGPNHPIVVTILNSLATLYRNQGQYAKAEVLYQQALALSEKTLGSDDTAAVTILNSLGILYRNQMRYEEAEALFQRALALSEKSPALDSITVSTLNSLATLYRNQGQYAKAEALYQQALALSEKTLGPNHPIVVPIFLNLARIYQEQKQHTKAEALYKEALALSEKVLGPDHPTVVTILFTLARMYRNQERFAEAEALYQQALALSEKKLEPRTTIRILKEYTALLRKMDRAEEAAVLNKRLKALMTKPSSDTS